MEQEEHGEQEEGGVDGARGTWGVGGVDGARGTWGVGGADGAGGTAERAKILVMSLCWFQANLV